MIADEGIDHDSRGRGKRTSKKAQLKMMPTYIDCSEFTGGHIGVPVSLHMCSQYLRARWLGDQCLSDSHVLDVDKPLLGSVMVSLLHVFP